MVIVGQSRPPEVRTITTAPIRATSRTSEATSKATAQSVNRLLPSAVKLRLTRSESGAAVPTMVAAMTPKTAMATTSATGHCGVVGQALEVLDAREHEREQDDDDDCAAVYEQLRQREELCQRNQEQPGDSDHRGEQAESRIDDIAAHDHDQRAPERKRPGDIE